MSHDPEKSKVLCVVAKGGYWIAGSVYVYCMLRGIYVIYKLFRDPQSNVIVRLWRGSGVDAVLIVGMSIALVVSVLLLWRWADHYRRNC